MKLSFKKVGGNNIAEVYQLLQDQKFPYLPDNINQTKDTLNKLENHAYVGYTSQNKLVLFLCFCEIDSKLYFDIACLKDYEKKWASKSTLKFIFNKAFNDLDYQEMYVESLVKRARFVVEKFGFKKVVNCFYKISAESEQVIKYLK